MPTPRILLVSALRRSLALFLIVTVVALAALGSARDASAGPGGPQITDLEIAATAPEWVILAWNTTSEAGARVTFVESGRTVDSALSGTRHRIDLTGLECGTDYDLEISSPVGSGEEPPSIPLRVTSGPCPTPDSPWEVDPGRPIPLPAPEITELTVVTEGSDSADIGWVVDRFSGASVVLSGPDGGELTFSSPAGSGPTVVRAVGLACDTTYRAVVRATGPTGAESVVPTEVVTGPCPSPEPANISVSPGTDRMVVTWSTSTPTLGQVSWGADPLADTLVAVTEPAGTHEVQIEGLECGTTYWLRVAAIDAESPRIGWSPEIVARTSECPGDNGAPDAPALNLVGVGTRVEFDRADITWTTDLVSVATVEIGPVGTEADLVIDSGPGVDHSVTAEGLECGTTYSYRILARAEGSPGPPAPPDAVESGEFTTSGCEGMETTIDALTVESGVDRAVLVFDTPVPTTAFVQWGTSDLYDFALETSELVIHHEIALEGLQCGTLYHFDIEVLAAGPDMPAPTGDLTFGTRSCEDQEVPDPGAVPALS